MNEQRNTVERTTAEAAEISVVGAMLIDSACVGDVILNVRADDFRNARCRALFTAARDLYLAQEPVDVVTVTQKAGGGELFELARECMDVTPTAANVAHYCQVVRDQAALARVHKAAGALAAATDLDEARDILAKAQGALSDKPGVSVVSLSEMMADFFRRLAQPKPDYLHWGLGMLDSMLYTAPGSYVILAARPSIGKTAMALQLSLNVAMTKRVGFFSLETSAATAGDRIGAANLSLTLPQIKARRVDRTDMQALATQLGQSEALRGDFDFISAAGMTVSDIRTLTLAKRYDVIFIDYVQLIQPSGRGDRTEMMQSVSMELRAMAQLTGVVIVALAQLRRPDSQSKKPTAPTMADLKESGQFEQDADTILLMYLEEPGNRLSDRRLKIEKNKEGYAGFAARFRFDGRKQRFTYVDNDGKDIPDKPKFEAIDDGQEEMDLPF